MSHKSLWAVGPAFYLVAAVAAAAPPAPDSVPPAAAAAAAAGDPMDGSAGGDDPVGETPAIGPDWTIYPRLSLTHETGPGVGYNEGFTTFEGMIPLFQRPQRSLWFADLRGLLSDDTLLGANAGAGCRFYSPAWDRTFGVNAYYDNRDTGQATFNQVSAGFESLGCWWDFRANGYWPVGNERTQVGDAFVNPQLLTTTSSNTTLDCSDPTFSGHNILYEQITAVSVNQTLTQDRVRRFEAAMKGFDAEAGMPSPFLPRLWAFAGVYCFEADASPQAWGIRGRLEARLSHDVILNLVVQNDRVFNTTVTFQGGFTWGGLRGWRHTRCVASDRLGDRVERNYDIVVAHQTTQQAVSTLVSSATTTTKAPVVAIDPATGLPVFFDHADSHAAAGGDGTFEHPFNNLAALQGGSHPGDILYVHANSVFDGAINPLNQGFTLQDNQRFLGEGPACLHTYNSTQCGTMMIPLVNAGGAAPIIDNSNGNSITLANNNEVSGFNINPSGAASTSAHGIFGQGVTNFNINCNTIGLTNFGGGAPRARLASPANGASSIFLLDTMGTGLIALNTLHAEAFSFANDADAIHIENSGTTALNVTISGNTIVGGAPAVNQGFNSGIFISTADAAQVTATISGNRIGNAAADVEAAGIALVSSDSSVLAAVVSQNDISGNRGDGIDLFAFDSSQLSLRADGNTIGNNGAGLFSSNGITAVNFGTGALTTVLTNNAITDNGGSGVFLINTSATASGNVVADNFGDGIDVISSTGTFSGNVVTGNQGVGVFVVDGTTIFSGNRVSGNTENGFVLVADNPMKTSIVNNVITGNGLAFLTNAGGIHSEVDAAGVEQDLSITGNFFSGNTSGAAEVFGAAGSTVGLRLTANTSDGDYLLDNTTNGTGVFNVENWPGGNLGNLGAGMVLTNPAGFPPAFFTLVAPDSVPVQP